MTEKVFVGKNWYRTDSEIPERETDDSVARRHLAQYPVPPDSLLWKYVGDLRVQSALGLRTAVIENMYPQLGQGVSDHSVLFSGKGTFLERVRRSAKPIQSVIYREPDAARKSALQVRNFHKSIKGDMPDGRKYHAINAETYYWAHVTFFEAIYRASELGVLRKPLTRDEREQIFEESKEWYSMYGVDDSAQPQTYAEFEEYLDHVLHHELVANGMSETSVRLSERSFGNPKVVNDISNVEGMNPLVARYIIRPLIPVAGWYARLTTLGSMGPHLRELGNAQWSAKDERQYRWLCRFLHATTVLTDVVVPFRFYYTPEAVAGFAREGLQPRDITLESARRALAKARAERTSAVVESDPEPPAVTAADPSLLDGTHSCAKCDRLLAECADCLGNGTVDGAACDICAGSGAGCPVHHAMWRAGVQVG
ncbi:oxygenase MpaB family protein [Gordonia sp. CPCC 205333]|uniref:oxygenase MpaB family protein n=1 Tax=Gordonia sp. CPCC 205333 TaxID=3140790 RepID=UPI003AF3ABAB